ncbi:MAG: sensor histidine kinase [Xenococcaceae cyanobacterium]
MSHPDHIFISPSSEFVALCQSQMALLTQGLGAAWSAVYLTEGLVENAQAKLIPVAVYPQTDKIWQEDNRCAVLPEVSDRVDSTPPLLSAALPEEIKGSINEAQIDSPTSKWEEQSLMQRRQIVLPLIYEDVVMGLLVTRREDREWNQEEFAQIEKIARTLAIARLLDQRQGWYQQQLSEQQNIQRIERDRLDDLLHQLRNPLTALRTFSKLLLKRLLPEDRNQSVAKGILQESDRLQELLQEFEDDLDLMEKDPPPLTLSLAPVSLHEASPVSTHTFLLPGNSLSLEPVAVREVLEPLLVSAEAIAQEREIDLSADIPPNLPPTQANAKALREVLNNLIDNALKYTPARGQVDIRVGMEQSTSTGLLQGIAIRDTGYGIPPEDQEHIFERHYRGVQAQGDISGSGLGLAIAKELVEQMHGKIELISPNESTQATPKFASLSGTTFIIWLPVAADTFTSTKRQINP